jgi:hypothetical protein
LDPIAGPLQKLWREQYVLRVWPSLILHRLKAFRVTTESTVGEKRGYVVSFLHRQEREKYE